MLPIIFGRRRTAAADPDGRQLVHRSCGIPDALPGRVAEPPGGLAAATINTASAAGSTGGRMPPGAGRPPRRRWAWPSCQSCDGASGTFLLVLSAVLWHYRMERVGLSMWPNNEDNMVTPLRTDTTSLDLDRIGTSGISRGGKWKRRNAGGRLMSSTSMCVIRPESCTPLYLCSHQKDGQRVHFREYLTRCRSTYASIILCGVYFCVFYGTRYMYEFCVATAGRWANRNLCLYKGG